MRVFNVNKNSWEEEDTDLDILAQISVGGVSAFETSCILFFGLNPFGKGVVSKTEFTPEEQTWLTGEAKSYPIALSPMQVYLSLQLNSPFRDTELILGQLTAIFK